MDIHNSKVRLSSNEVIAHTTLIQLPPQVHILDGTWACIISEVHTFQYDRANIHRYTS